MLPTSQSFAVMLKQLRAAHGMTQEELAERSGTSVRSISDLERGISRFPHKNTVQLLVEALALPPDEAEQLFTLARASKAPGDALTSPDGPLPVVGRAREIAHVEQRLKDPELRMLTLIGVAGVGKTRLALECVPLVRAAFADGIRIVDCSAIQAAAYVVPAIAQTLGVREQPSRPLLDELIRWIGNQHMLLVLDNCEHILEARGSIAELLENCQSLAILATSREKFGIPAEEALVVLPLATPADIERLAVDEHLAEYPAILLFLEYTRMLQGELQLTPVLIRTIASICTHLDGIPLAIELAAARMPALPARTILAQLTGSPRRRFFEVLRLGTESPPARQRTLRDALAWSYHLLEPREQMMFRRASVFAGGWTIDAAQALGDPHHLLNVDMLSVLNSLANKSLIQPDTQPDGSLRYKMHFVMRAYGHELLQERKEENAIYRQLAEYYATLVEELEQRLTGTGQAESLNRLILEYENIRLVLQWAREHQAIVTGLRISSSLWWFWENRGYLTEGRDWLEGMLDLYLEHPEATDDETAARAYYGAAVLAIIQGDSGKGADYGEKSLAHMRLPSKRARILLMLGNLAKQEGDTEKALRLYTEGLATLRELDDARGLVVALNNLSTLYIERGEMSRALPLLEESIALKRALGDQRGVAVSLMNQGEVLKAQGQYAQALTTTQTGLDIFLSLGDSRGEAFAYNNLGEIAEAAGEGARAIEAYTESVNAYRRIEDRPGVAMALEHLGELYNRRQDSQGAVYLQEAELLRQELGHKGS